MKKAPAPGAADCARGSEAPPAVLGTAAARVVLAAFLLLLVMPFLPSPVGAQEGPVPMEPEEPAIVLPEVILKTEDISVEQVEAGIPQEDEVLPPEREVPLPEAGELVIQEPSLEMQPPEGESALPQEGAAAPLVAEGVLGAGSMYHIYSSISLFRAEDEPRFQLKFLHEMLDGFSGNDPGRGFNLREDSLDGSIRFHMDTLSLEIQGLLSDSERGLQRRSPFASEVERTVGLQAVSALPLSPMWTFGAGVNSHLASELLTAPMAGAPSPSGVTELLLQPEVYGQVRTDRVQFRLTGRYAWRSLLENTDLLLQRLTVNANLAVTLPREFRLEGDVSWLASSEQGSLFPFSLAVSGSPVDPLSFSLRGGYRVQQVNLRDVLQSFDYTAIPTRLEDNHGWFGEVGAAVNLFRNLILNGQATLSWDSAMPDPDPTPDANGLFPFDQRRATRLTSIVSLRWNPSSSFSLRGGWDMEWMDRPAFIPPVRLRLESEGLGARGVWGWHAAAVWDWEGFQLPLVDMNGYYRISEKIRMILEVNDFLQPLQNAPRRIHAPYEEPGIRGTVKVQITL